MRKALDELIAMVDLQGMLARRDDGLQIGLDKILGQDELFPKNMQGLIAADEACEQDPAIRDDGDGWNLGVGPQYQGSEVMLLAKVSARMLESIFCTNAPPPAPGRTEMRPEFSRERSASRITGLPTPKVSQNTFQREACLLACSNRQG